MLLILNLHGNKRLATNRKRNIKINYWAMTLNANITKINKNANINIYSNHESWTNNNIIIDWNTIIDENQNI